MGQYCFAGRVDSRPLQGQVRGQSGDRHCMAGQYGYVLLGRHLVFIWYDTVW